MHKPTLPKVQHRYPLHNPTHLSSGSSSEVVDELSLWLEELNVGTVVDDLLLSLEGLVVGSVEGSETPLLGDDDLLSSGELVSSSSESLDDDGLVGVSASDRHDDLSTDCQGGSKQSRRQTHMLTRATQPYGLPQAPRIPCCNLSLERVTRDAFFD